MCKQSGFECGGQHYGKLSPEQPECPLRGVYVSSCNWYQCIDVTVAVQQTRLNHEEGSQRMLPCPRVPHPAWHKPLLVPVQAQHVPAELLLRHIESLPFSTYKSHFHSVAAFVNSSQYSDAVGAANMQQQDASSIIMLSTHARTHTCSVHMHGHIHAQYTRTDTYMLR